MKFEDHKSLKITLFQHLLGGFPLPRGLPIAPRVVVALGQQRVHVLSEAGRSHVDPDATRSPPSPAESQKLWYRGACNEVGPV